jgi:hypothetical protein
VDDKKEIRSGKLAFPIKSFARLRAATSLTTDQLLRIEQQNHKKKLLDGKNKSFDSCIGDLYIF